MRLEKNIIDELINEVKVAQDYIKEKENWLAENEGRDQPVAERSLQRTKDEIKAAQDYIAQAKLMAGKLT